MRGWMVAAVIAVVANVGWAAPTITIDLNAPGALEELRRADPGEYAKVVSIVRRVELGGTDDIDRVVRLRYGGSAGSQSNLLLTTFPPQGDFTFTLGERTYRGRTGLRLRAEILRAGQLPRLVTPRAEIRTSTAGR